MSFEVPDENFPDHIPHEWLDGLEVSPAEPAAEDPFEPVGFTPEDTGGRSISDIVNSFGPDGRPVTAPEGPLQDDVTRAYECTADTRFNPITALFKNLAEMDDLPDDGSFNLDTPGADDISNPLAAFDTSDPEADTRLAYEMNIEPYRASLDRAGLRAEAEGNPQLAIVDGEKFAEYLRSVPADRATLTLAHGTGRSVDNALRLIKNNFLPDTVDDDYTTFSTPRTPYGQEQNEHSDAIVENGAFVIDHSSREVLAHADAIAAGLANVGNAHTAVRLRAAQEAHGEGLLGHWAVADEMSLYGRAAGQNYPWMNWDGLTASDWNRAHQLLDDAEIHAPVRSRMLVTLATAIDTALRDYQDEMRRYEETPGINGEVLPPRGYADDDTEMYRAVERALGEQESQAFDTELDRLQQHARDLIIRHSGDA